jgi:TonB family protein
MMKPWLDSFAKSSTLPTSVTLSVAAHVLLIGAAIAATATTDAERPLPENSIARFLAPPDRPSGQQAQREMVRYVAISVPTISPSFSAEPPRVLEEVKPLQEIVGRDERDAAPMPELHGEDSVFSILEVDSAASRYEWSAAPAYPPRMLEKRTEGAVRVEFIVLQDGYADTASLRVIVSTHDDFTKAVRDALPFMRFKPAKIGRDIVSQLVLQEFRFQVTTDAPDTLATRKPPT